MQKVGSFWRTHAPSAAGAEFAITAATATVKWKLGLLLLLLLHVKRGPPAASQRNTISGGARCQDGRRKRKEEQSRGE